MPNYRFYGVNIDTPLSLAHNTSDWSGSTIGQLNAKTNGQVLFEKSHSLVKMPNMAGAWWMLSFQMKTAQ